MFQISAFSGYPTLASWRLSLFQFSGFVMSRLCRESNLLVGTDRRAVRLMTIRMAPAMRLQSGCKGWSHAVSGRAAGTLAVLLLNGAMVHVSMVGFDLGKEKQRQLNGQPKKNIPPNLSGGLDITASARLSANAETGFIGVSMHGSFDMEENSGLAVLKESGNPNLKPNSDVLRPVLDANEITKRGERRWLVSFPPDGKFENAVGYAAPMKFVRENVLPAREKNHRKTYRDNWWLPGEARPAMQMALAHLPRFIATPRVSKHRIFVWISPECLPSDATVAFASSNNFLFGLLHSRFHEVWSLAQNTQLREKESGFRYTPTTCFETFPFPRPTPAQEAAIAAAAQELNELRERWLNPPEWTRTEILEFPATVGGPWDRYLNKAAVPAAGGDAAPRRPDGPEVRPCPIGTVRYPRLVPKDPACAARLKKRTLTNLYNERPAWLDLAHRQLDAAVAAAYGWPADLTAELILEKLLALNLERAAEEAKAAKMNKPKTSREKHAEEML